MPAKQLRRLTVPVTDSLYDRITRHALSVAYSRSEADEVERAHPELIIERDGNIVAAFGEHDARLMYGFEGNAAFIDHFPGMLERLLPRIRRELRSETVRFRLTHAPSRPVVEPVLRKLHFTALRSWLGFSLDRRAGVPKAPAPRGVKFRDGSVADLDEIMRIDRECFPDTPMPREAMRWQLEHGEEVLLAEAGREVAGTAIYSMTDEGDGYLRVLAVGEAHRGRGIGAALTARVAKRVFAAGAKRLDLKTEEDNGEAIRLYVRLGFKQTTAGRDYERPTNPRAIAKIKAEGQGILIRFGGWR